jgi:hypothetical protein
VSKLHPYQPLAMIAVPLVDDPTCQKGRPYIVKAVFHMKTLLYNPDTPEAVKVKLLARLGSEVCVGSSNVFPSESADAN